jgi:hypothetical protein
MPARWGSVVIAVTLTIGAVTPARAQDCSGMTFYAASTVVLASALIDISTAAGSARKYNSTHLSVAPTYDPHRGALGFAARLSFGRSRPGPAPRTVATRVQAPPPPRKSPTTASSLSFGFTAIPIAIAFAMKSEGSAYPFLAGAIVGPSVGHLYAGQTGRGLATVALRTGAAVIGISSIVACFGD